MNRLLPPAALVASPTLVAQITESLRADNLKRLEEQRRENKILRGFLLLSQQPRMSFTSQYAK